MSPGISLNPQTFSMGIGLDDVVVLITSARFEMFEFGSTGSRPALVFKGDSDEGQEVSQAWGVGSPEDWAPSEDGKTLIQTGTKNCLHQTANAGLLLTSLINAGFPADQLDAGDCSVFEGYKFHFIAIPPKGRTKMEGQDEVSKVSIVDDIVAMPSKGGTKKRTASKAGRKTKTAAGDLSDAELSTVAEAALLAAVEEIADGELMAIKPVASAAYKKLKHKQKRDILNLMLNDDWLSEDERPWTYMSDDKEIMA